METQSRRFKLSASALEWIAVAVVIATAITLAILGVWLFRKGATASDTSLPRVILSDRATLGFVRLLTATAALYGLASITVLVMRGRWLRAISATGIEFESASDTDKVVNELTATLRQYKDERDEARQLLWRYLRG